MHLSTKRQCSPSIVSIPFTKNNWLHKSTLIVTSHQCLQFASTTLIDKIIRHKSRVCIKEIQSYSIFWQMLLYMYDKSFMHPLPLCLHLPWPHLANSTLLVGGGLPWWPMDQHTSFLLCGWDNNTITYQSAVDCPCSSHITTICCLSQMSTKWEHLHHNEMSITWLQSQGIDKEAVANNHATCTCPSDYSAQSTLKVQIPSGFVQGCLRTNLDQNM